MTRQKKAAAPAVDDGPNPMRGGAFVRMPDGSLVRDTSEDQHIPADEVGPADEDALRDAPSPSSVAPQDERAAETADEGAE